MPLTDTPICNAKPREKPYKLADGGPMHLSLTPSGSKLWRLAYRFDGKETLLAPGAYPQVALKGNWRLGSAAFSGVVPENFCKKK